MEVVSNCHRKDKENIIFKKLEKVGDPYTEGNSIVGERTCQEYRMYEKNFFLNERDLLFTSYGDIVSIEINQIKEDMEEREIDPVELPEDIEKIAKETVERTGRMVAEEIESQIKANLKQEELSKLKPFDLEAARSGKPVCTRDGRKARIICFDKTPPKGYEDFKIVALINNNDNEDVHVFNEKGKKYSEDCRSDLMMLPEKKTGWINIYPYQCKEKVAMTGSYAYKTQKEAKEAASGDCIATIPIEWKE